MQGWYIGITAASQAVKAGSTPVPCSKKKNRPLGGFSFWNAAGRVELAASTCAKRVKSRGKGKAPANGSAIRGMPGSEFEPRLFCCAEREKKKHHPSGWCFLFGMPRAGLNLLPRPARSALNQEVRQGSCEWLCHSWDAGSESSLVARSKKKNHPLGGFSFWSGDFAAQNRSPAGG